MATITNNVRWADNTAELKKNLLEGVGTIEAMKSSVDRTAAALGGQGLLMQANKVAAAIDQLGGVTKLTAAEQERANGLLDKAIEKYKAMGMTAPPAMVALRDSMKGAGDSASGLIGAIDNLGRSFAARIVEGLLLRDAIREVLSLAKDAVTDAAQFDDLSRATGLSIQEVQKFAYVGQEFNVDTEQMGRAVENLSRRLASGDGNAKAAVEGLGLSVKALIEEGPKEAFLDIAEAVGRVEDPMKRSQFAAELFGARLGNVLLPALGDLRQKLEEVPKDAIISDANVKAAHDFDVAVQHLETRIKALSIAVLEYAANSEHAGLNDLAKLNLYGPKPGGGSDIDLTSSGVTPVAISNAVLLQNRLNALRAEAVVPLTLAQKDNIVSLHDWGVSEKEIAQLVGSNEVAVRLYLKAHQDARTELKKFQEAVANLEPILTSPMWDGSIDSMLKLGGSVRDTALYFGQSEGVIKKHVDAMKALADVTRIEASPALAQFVTHLHEIGTDVPQKAFDDIYNSISKIQDIEHGTTKGLSDLPKAAKPAMEDLATAFTPAQKAVLLFSQSIQNLPAIIMSAVSGHNVIGALSGLGATLTGGLFGGAGQDAGPLAGITKGIQGAVTGALSGLGKTASGLIGKFASSFLPGIGSLIGPAISALMNIGGPSQQELSGRKVEGDFQSSFGSFDDMMAAVGKAYAATGRTAQQAQSDVAALMQAEKQGGDAAQIWVDKINGAFTEQQQDAADLQTAIQKYGFTIDQLGPTMQKQKLDEQAQGLINDWRLLVGSGIQVTTVNTQMASSVQDYLTMALKTGQEVPEAMKPILQSMVDQGTLTDANGNKLTDLSNIKWSETMSEGFQKVVDKLDELLTKIGMVPGVIAKIPTTIDVGVNFTEQSNLPNPIPMAAGGAGRVTRPTLFLVGEQGAEDYAFSGGGRSFSGSGGDSSGGDINHTTNVYMDGKLVNQSVERIQTRNLHTRRKLAAA